MEGKSVCSKTQIFSYLALSLGIIGLIVAGYLTRASTDTQFNISSVVELQRWWVLKSKIFAMW